jgi:hypothetical protein
MARWRDFERLAERIYRELSPAATVTWNDHIPGEESGIPRQIDVSIRWTSGDDAYLTIVQAKDWKHRADINAVGEFASVIRDVGASQGILVCRAGFTGNAMKYARNIGVGLHNLHDAESQNWRQQMTIPLLWTSLLPTIHYSLQARFEAGDQVKRDEGSFRFSIDGGATVADVKSTFARHWNDGLIDRTPGHRHKLPKIEGANVRIRRGGKATWVPADIQIDYSVERKAWLGQFQPGECRGIIDHLDDETFTATYLSPSSVPFERDKSWQAVEDPSKIAPTLRGTVVVTEEYQIDPASSQFTDFTIRYLGP